MHIVFLDRDTLASQTTLKPLSFPHTLTVYSHTNPNEVVSRIQDADIVIVNKVKITNEHLRNAPRLKLIAVAATGTDNIDLAACQSHEIIVSNIRNYAGNSVPEHTFSLIFALRRQLLAYHNAIKAGRWQASGKFCFFDYPIQNLANSTLGLIGTGALGQAVKQIALAFGMNVLLAEHKGQAPRNNDYVTFETVLEQADIISIHCPLNDQTRHLISTHEFSLMQQRPLLINTSRGGIVDEQALCQALENGQISGAGFDVVSSEPPPKDHVFMQLLDRPNFILTPHVAWASDQAMQTLADQLIDNIHAFVHGSPRNVVN